MYPKFKKNTTFDYLIYFLMKVIVSKLVKIITVKCNWLIDAPYRSYRNITDRKLKYNIVFFSSLENKLTYLFF